MRAEIIGSRGRSAQLLHGWHDPSKVAHHSQRSTIARHYSTEEIERVVERNRLLFQLRNFTKASSVERVISDEEVLGFGTVPRVR